MADKNTKISVELETRNAQTIKDLRDEFDRLKEELKQTTLAYHQGQISEAEYQAKAETLKASMREVKTSVDNLGESLRKAKSGMAGFGQSALQTGRVVQDFVQGGIGGILNNIEGLSQALGGGPGLAGVMTIVGVAAFIAMPHIQKFLDSLSSDEPKTFAEEMGKIEERIKELTNKKHKIAVDYEDLEHAKDQLEAMKKIEQEIKHLRDANTSDESKQKTAVQKAIIESGKEGKVEKGIIDSGIININDDKAIREMQSEYEHLKGKHSRGEDTISEKMRMFDLKDQIEERIKVFQQETARKLIVDAETDAKALEKLHEAAAKHPENFGPGFEEKLAEAHPDVRRLDKEDKEFQKDLVKHRHAWKRTHAKDKAEERRKKAETKLAEDRWTAEQDNANLELDQSNKKYIRLKKKRAIDAKKKQTALARKVASDRRNRLRTEKKEDKAEDKIAKQFLAPIKHSLPFQMLGMVSQGATPAQSQSAAVQAVDQNLAAQGVQDHHAIAVKVVDEAMKEIRKKMAAQSASGLTLDAKIMRVMQEFSNEQDVVIRRQRSLEQHAEQLQRQVSVRRRKT